MGETDYTLVSPRQCITSLAHVRALYNKPLPTWLNLTATPNDRKVHDWGAVAEIFRLREGGKNLVNSKTYTEQPGPAFC